MTELATLKIRVDSLEARAAERDLGRLAKTGDTVGVATARLTGFIRGLAGALASAGLAAAALGKLISVQREFDVINAGLITATGSAQNASLAFRELQGLAAKTPFDLAQVSQAFVTLVNRGLDPSEEAIISYGNTASAMGKTLEDMVRAVAQATTGEFETMKSFGVVMKKQGDDIAATFRGTTTVIGNNAREIEAYVQKLGNVDFAGAMEERMKTLDGAISNLGDAWDQMFLSLSGSGIGEAIADGVRWATEQLGDLNDYLASGEFEENMAGWAAAFQPFMDAADTAVDFVWTIVKGFSEDVQHEMPTVKDALFNAWRDYPANVQAMVELAVNYFASQVEDLKIRAQGLVAAFKAIFSNDQIQSAVYRMNDALTANKQNYKDGIMVAFANRDATLAVAAATDKAAEAARRKYEADKKGRSKHDLGQYRVGGEGAPGGGEGGAADKAKKAAERAAEQAQKQRERDFQQLKDSLRTEEEKIAESYAKRKAIIELNTVAGSDARANLMTRLDTDLREEEAKLAESHERRRDQARQGLQTEEQELTEHFIRRREMILKDINDPAEREMLLMRLQMEKDARLAFLVQEREEDRARLLQWNMDDFEALYAHHEAELAELKRANEAKLITDDEYRKTSLEREAAYRESRRQLAATSLEGMMGDVAGAMKAWLGEESKGYKIAFAMQKAFTIAKGAMAIQASISAAIAKGWPQNIPLIIQAISQGAKLMADIRGVTYSGAYDKGGMIPSGKWGIVGEYGPEIVNGPAKVTSRADTARMMQNTSNEVNINSQINIDASGAAESSTGDQNRRARELQRMIDNSAKMVVQREMKQGGEIWKMQNGVR